MVNLGLQVCHDPSSKTVILFEGFAEKSLGVEATPGGRKRAGPPDQGNPTHRPDGSNKGTDLGSRCRFWRPSQIGNGTGPIR